MAITIQNELETFLSQFNFNSNFEGLIGIERERFIIDKKGKFAPQSKNFLEKIQNNLWTYELSACQIEDRITPSPNIGKIKTTLAENDKQGQSVAQQLGLQLIFLELAEKDMPLDIYPDPRYMQIAKTIAPKRLEAACRVAATHIHIGMPNIERAILVANHLKNYIDYLCQLGDHSRGERLHLYKVMAQTWNPPYYENVEHFYKIAKETGFTDNPRDCWHLIRISRHGTVELRMFGATASIEEICNWIMIVKRLIAEI